MIRWRECLVSLEYLVLFLGNAATSLYNQGVDLENIFTHRSECDLSCLAFGASARPNDSPSLISILLWLNSTSKTKQIFCT